MFSQCCFCKYWLNAPNYTFFYYARLIEKMSEHKEIANLNFRMTFPKMFYSCCWKSCITILNPETHNSLKIPNRWLKKVRVFFCHWSLFWFWTDDKNIKTLDTSMSLPIAPHTVPQTKIFVAGSCTVTMTKCVLLLAFPLIIVPLFSDQMCGCEKFTIRYRIPRTIMNYRIS